MLKVEERHNQGVYLIDKFKLNNLRKLSSIQEKLSWTREVNKTHNFDVKSDSLNV